MAENTVSSTYPQDAVAKQRQGTFVWLRGGMVLAFRHWLATNPDSADIWMEIDGTVAAIEQLRDLASER